METRRDQGREHVAEESVKPEEMERGKEEVVVEEEGEQQQEYEKRVVTSMRRR